MNVLSFMFLIVCGMEMFLKLCSSKSRWLVSINLFLLSIIIGILILWITAHNYIITTNRILNYYTNINKIVDIKSELDHAYSDKYIINNFFSKIPVNNISKLQLYFNKRIFKLAKKYNVILANIAYSYNNKFLIDKKILESASVNFDLIGHYNNLKLFMFNLEHSETNAVVTEAILNDNITNGHLSVKMLIFWQPYN